MLIIKICQHCSRKTKLLLNQLLSPKKLTLYLPKTNSHSNRFSSNKTRIKNACRWPVTGKKKNYETYYDFMLKIGSFNSLM